MAKKFNTTGICIPSLHYMVDTTTVIDKIVKDYIEPGEYFTMNRARQYGKTTTLELLYQELKANYIVLDISFEAADEYFASLESLAKGLIMDIGERITVQGVPTYILDEWKKPLSTDFPLRDLGKRISFLCSHSDKEVVLMIDEVDKNADNQIFLSLLGLLRDKYLKQKMGKDSTFKSVVLAGVYDIKNLKLKMHPMEESKYNSPWNIAADFTVDMSFTVDGIKDMLQSYESDHDISIDLDSISRKIYDYTSGYPYLVSRLCKIMDEQVLGKEGFPTLAESWSLEGFQMAVNIILYESNTLFDDMRKKLDDFQTLSKMIRTMLFTGQNIIYNPDHTEMYMAIRFGFIKVEEGQIAIANRIFETRLYNYFLSQEIVQSQIYKAALQSKNQFTENGTLDMELVLKKFVEHFTDIYGNSTDRFVEENGRQLFLLYLKPIINGTGNYYVESRTRSMGRTDVIVDYYGRQYIIEMKIYRGNEYNRQGEEQLIGYLDDHHLQTGYMISFCFNKNKQVGVKKICRGDKVLIEAIV